MSTTVAAGVPTTQVVRPAPTAVATAAHTALMLSRRELSGSPVTSAVRTCTTCAAVSSAEPVGSRTAAAPSTVSRTSRGRVVGIGATGANKASASAGVTTCDRFNVTDNAPSTASANPSIPSCANTAVSATRSSPVPNVESTDVGTGSKEPPTSSFGLETTSVTPARRPVSSVSANMPTLVVGNGIVSTCSSFFAPS